MKWNINYYKTHKHKLNAINIVESSLHRCLRERIGGSEGGERERERELLCSTTAASTVEYREETQDVRYGVANVMLYWNRILLINRHWNDAHIFALRFNRAIDFATVIPHMRFACVATRAKHLTCLLLSISVKTSILLIQIFDFSKILKHIVRLFGFVAENH